MDEASHATRCDELGALLALTTEQVRIAIDTHGMDSELRALLGQAAGCISLAQGTAHVECLRVHT